MKSAYSRFTMINSEHGGFFPQRCRRVAQRHHSAPFRVVAGHRARSRARFLALPRRRMCFPLPLGMNPQSRKVVPLPFGINPQPQKVVPIRFGINPQRRKVVPIPFGIVPMRLGVHPQWRKVVPIRLGIGRFGGKTPLFDQNDRFCRVAGVIHPDWA